jgi:hypothetical protein
VSIVDTIKSKALPSINHQGTFSLFILTSLSSYSSTIVFYRATTSAKEDIGIVSVLIRIDSDR